MKTIIEPFRIKSVEPIRLTSRPERERLARAAGYNLFGLHSDDVLIDLLTDSGTGAMSSLQWAAVMQGDESYAGSPSFFRFEAAVQNLMPFKHIIPTHQGRAAEAILFSIFGGKGRRIPSNTHFDTTRGNIEASGATGDDLVIAEGKDPQNLHPFKGNMDLARLEAYLEAHHAEVPLVMITITNNAGGGQPVSLANIRAVADLAHRYGKPFVIDGCRFAENAWFIKTREEGQADRSIPEIVRDCFAVADGMTMSAKKDAFGNIGGWLALNDDDLAEEARGHLIRTEGFPTYGGLAGRDLDALAQGLVEIVDEDYLRYRIRTHQYIVERLDAMGVPVVKPAGGHAVFIDARAWLSHIPPLEYPGQALAVALYEIAGVRSCEIGTAMFGRQPDGSEKPAAMDLVRLAFPRRTYTQSHADYIVEAFEELAATKDALRGYRIVKEPKLMRHFTCRFEKL
ncbi:tryptophanase [Rhodobacter capsulatus]|uniref:Tryptophanase n=2 Tax=Rhodobacter capsulatus TaxID=1061 RepID=TNAA_RHOCA|nr:tryptophanase [Rhodobacter capsulatus]O30971.1 RecName: Full=Tryptophanase; AltName: Full=L-tryptophan indole-lyase; Short=TNase [Rhodobacter capsulatus]AAC64208.1 tyrosine-phenol-lyase [Rhodobacter capsulatus]KQB14408.1 tyrosine phenol-lyase [Rhodobacter capsulatus]KQB15062.1 tyrosine phenol-lyase [Rhodobacter capsulatus]PZX26272.1 tryptophanase [Rhodobacter capsulatus]QNR64177.1 tryptophanase [Rhodobacter capsulatus]